MCVLVDGGDFWQMSLSECGAAFDLYFKIQVSTVSSPFRLSAYRIPSTWLFLSRLSSGSSSESGISSRGMFDADNTSFGAEIPRAGLQTSETCPPNSSSESGISNGGIP